jgi:hypothetical protein
MTDTTLNELHTSDCPACGSQIPIPHWEPFKCPACGLYLQQIEEKLILRDACVFCGRLKSEPHIQMQHTVDYRFSNCCCDCIKLLHNRLQERLGTAI